MRFNGVTMDTVYCRKFFNHITFIGIFLASVTAYPTTPSAAIITGRITDSLHNPLSGTIVRLANANLVDTTKLDGTFSFNLQVGNRVTSVSASQAAFSSIGDKVRIESNIGQTMQFRMYDYAGRLCSAIAARKLARGTNVIRFDKTELPATEGSYIMSAMAPEFYAQWKIMIVSGKMQTSVLSQRRTAQLAKSGSIADSLVISKPGYQNAIHELASVAGQDLGDIILSPFIIAIMSFNIRGPYDTGTNAWANRRDKVITVINTYHPDVIGFQELVPEYMADIVTGCPHYAFYGIGRESTGLGESSRILYRSDIWRIDSSNAGTFWYSPTPNIPGSMGWGETYPRICTHARLVNKQTGVSFYHFNSHWAYESQKAQDSTSKMLIDSMAHRRFTDVPAVVTGDFNATDANSAVVYLKQNTILPLSDTYRLLYPNAPNSGTFHNWTGTQTGDKIDYILVPQNTFTDLAAEIIHYQVNNLYPSDHFPIYAEIRFTKNPGY